MAGGLSKTATFKNALLFLVVMELLNRLKHFVIESRRVLRVTKKPTKEEFRTIVKVSGIGILLIGLLGFLLQMIKQTLL